MKIEVEFTGELCRVLLAVAEKGGDIKQIVSRLAPISPSRVPYILRFLKDMRLVSQVRAENTGKDHGRMQQMPWVWSVTEAGQKAAAQLIEDLI